MRSKSLLAILTLFLVVGFLMMLPLGWTLAEDWTRLVYGGMSDTNNTVAMPGAVYNNSFYVGTANQNEGCQVSRYDGSAWTKVIGNGFGDPANWAATSMEVFDGNLYVATLNGAGGEVWRYNGTTWTQVNENGFGDKQNWILADLAVFGGQLYAGSGTSVSAGARVWRTSNGTTWNKVNTDGFGDPNNILVNSLTPIGSTLYACTQNKPTGCEIWSTSDGTNWTKVGLDGFGDKNNYSGKMETDGTNLFVGTGNYTTGTEVWKYAGGVWSQINTDGFGDFTGNGENMSYPATYGGNLYIGTDSTSGGCEVWKYAGGSWSQINTKGFGGSNSSALLSVYNGALFAGTQNYTTGYEVWKTQLGAPGLAVTSVTPSSGTVNTTVNITNLAGTGFVQGSTTTQVRLERSGATTINATSVAVPSSTQITCTFSLTGAQAGAYNVIVRNPNGQEASLGNGFTVVNAANPCGGGAAISVALAGLMFGLLSLAGSGSLRRRLGKTRK